MDNNKIIERLDRFAGDMITKKNQYMGYPVSQKSNLTGFYRWLMGSGMNLSMVDNAGDPFNIHGGPSNTLSFEKEVIEHFGPLYGFDTEDLWGIITFSGTDGNNHGIYFGSKYLEKKTGIKPVVYVSEAAHYSSMRLADLQNLDIRIIPADVHGCMIAEELDNTIIDSRPALVIYAIGTTFKGGMDDQRSLNEVLKKHPVEVYRHIDGALFGGYLPHSEYKDLLDRRIEPFDSIAVSGHKYFGMDEPAGFFLTTKTVKDNQNPFNVSYLNGNMPMINCSRSALSPLKFWWIINTVSPDDFTEQTKKMLQTARWLKEELEKKNIPVWLEKASNTVYFRRPSDKVCKKYQLAPDSDKRLGGELSHIVVMQHVTKERLKIFLNDI